MQPSRRDDDVLVDLLDVIVEEGVVLEADVLISVADIPLVGLKLRAALAGLTTMREYGMFEDWDVEYRGRRRERTRSSAAPSAPPPRPKGPLERDASPPPLTERPSRVSKRRPEGPDADSAVRPGDSSPGGRPEGDRPREESPAESPDGERPGRSGVAPRPGDGPTGADAGAEDESADDADDGTADRRDGEDGRS